MLTPYKSIRDILDRPIPYPSDAEIEKSIFTITVLRGNKGIFSQSH